METKDAREARRRKLLSRGTDRLAFITGQSRSLSVPDPPSLPLSSGSSVLGKCIEASETGTASIVGLTEEPTSSTVLGKCIEASDTGTASTVELTEEPTIVSSTTNEVFTTSASSGRAAQTVDDTSSEINNSNTVLRATGNFTLKEFSNSISSSENFRMLCSVIIALFTVILNHGFSLSVKFKPLVLVVITDLTIIFGLVVGSQVGESRRRLQNVDGGIMDMGKVIEGAVLFQKAMAAISMDCCICAVIMICALAV